MCHCHGSKSRARASRPAAARWDTACMMSKEKNMHLSLALHALELMWAKAGMHELMMTGMPIWAAGNYDADHLNPYADNCLWIAHFWDPHTDTNYKGLKWPTAKTSINEWWAESVKSAKSELGIGDALIKAMYNFGLALHYLGDLTQPMHAANYVTSSTNQWHTQFEELAQDWFNEAGVIAETYAEIDKQFTPDRFKLDDYIVGVSQQPLDNIAKITALESLKYIEALKTMHNAVTSNDTKAAKALLPKICASAIVNNAIFIYKWMSEVLPLAIRNLKPSEATDTLQRALGTQWNHARLWAWRNQLALTRCQSSPNMRLLCVYGNPKLDDSTDQERKAAANLFSQYSHIEMSSLQVNEASPFEMYASMKHEQENEEMLNLKAVGATNPYTDGAVVATVACPYTLQVDSCPNDPTGYVPSQCTNPNTDCVQSSGYSVACDALMCTNAASCQTSVTNNVYCKKR